MQVTIVNVCVVSCLSSLKVLASWFQSACLPPAFSFSFALFQVTVDVPDQKGRLEILKVHSRNKKLDTEVDLQEIALRTPGFAGADLANLLNEAAILAGRKSLPAVTIKEVDDAVDR